MVKRRLTRREAHNMILFLLRHKARLRRPPESDVDEWDLLAQFNHHHQHQQEPPGQLLRGVQLQHIQDRIRRELGEEDTSPTQDPVRVPARQETSPLVVVTGAGCMVVVIFLLVILLGLL